MSSVFAFNPIVGGIDKKGSGALPHYPGGEPSPFVGSVVNQIVFYQTIRPLGVLGDFFYDAHLSLPPADPAAAATAHIPSIGPLACSKKVFFRTTFPVGLTTFPLLSLQPNPNPCLTTSLPNPLDKVFIGM